jgi:Arc/MetJ-type ribon-helix-helix transcriptional regulator
VPPQSARLHTTQIAVRLPEALLRRLDALVPATHPSRADAVRRAVELYLYRLACEEDARRCAAQPLDDEELALADAPDAWAGTPPW